MSLYTISFAEVKGHVAAQEPGRLRYECFSASRCIIARVVHEKYPEFAMVTVVPGDAGGGGPVIRLYRSPEVQHNTTATPETPRDGAMLDALARAFDGLSEGVDYNHYCPHKSAVLEVIAAVERDFAA